MSKSGIHIKKSHEGLLHKNLGVAKGKKIPASKLKIKSTDSEAVRKRKQFALNAKHWHHKANGGFADSMLIEKNQFALGGEYTPDMNHLYLPIARNGKILNDSNQDSTINQAYWQNQSFGESNAPQTPQVPQYQEASYLPNNKVQDNTQLVSDPQLTALESPYNQPNTINSQKPILPKIKFYGNKYFQRAGDNLTDSIRFATQIYQPLPQKKTETNPNYSAPQEITPNTNVQIDENPNAGVQFKTTYKNGGLKRYDIGGETYYQNPAINNTNPINGMVNPAAIAGTAASSSLGFTNILEGGIDMFGSNRKNLGQQQRESNMFHQSLLNQAMNPTPYENKGFGTEGRNNVLESGGMVEAKELGGFFRKKIKPSLKTKKK